MTPIDINGLKANLKNHCNGLSFLSNSLESNLDVADEIFTFLYAHDTILLTESEEDMQKA